jgi:hypothetical protein
MFERGAMAANRRIGERILIAASRVTWAPIADCSNRLQDALIMELSVTGAALLAPSYPWMCVDDLVTVEFNNSSAVVTIRTIDQTDVEEISYYGVEFVSMERGFQRDVYEVIGRVQQRRPR